jgi:hypothetical protein
MFQEYLYFTHTQARTRTHTHTHTHREMCRSERERETRAELEVFTAFVCFLCSVRLQNNTASQPRSQSDVRHMFQYITYEIMK